MSAASPRGKKVLVVEDDPSFRHMLELVLSLEDDIDEVRSTDKGAEAISLCEDYRPDVVLVDHVMPSMSGNEVGSEIRRIRPETRIISLSGMERDATETEWADEHILKASTTLEDLKRAVHEHD